jgi:GNAT superfamily N-acetyltransferase
MQTEIIGTAHEYPIHKHYPGQPGFTELKLKSMAEGFNMLHRLEENWLNGQNRFDRPGEKLLGAYADDLIVGVCGLNIDPFTEITGTGRLRHLYVDTAWRRNHVGSGLLSEILKDAGLWFDFINTNAPSSAFTFYERAGFVALCDMDKVTPLLPEKASTVEHSRFGHSADCVLCRTARASSLY